MIVQCLQILSNSGSIPLSDNWAQGSFGSDIWTMKSHEGPGRSSAQELWRHGMLWLCCSPRLPGHPNQWFPNLTLKRTTGWFGEIIGGPKFSRCNELLKNRQSCSTCCFPGESWNKAYTGNACKIMQVNSLASLNFWNKTQLGNMFLFGGSNHPKICANWMHPSRPVSYQLTTAYPHCPHANACQ